MPHEPLAALPQTVARRQFFQSVAGGLGSVALASLLGEDSARAESGKSDPLGQKPAHFAPRAKSVIYIHLVGAPSQLDLFDYKPELQKRDGQLCPDAMFEGKRLAFIRTQPKLLGSPTTRQFAFQSCGQSGAMISNLLPHLQGVADELTLIRSLQTEQFNHGPAQLFMLTGFARFGRPSIGSWLTYGLGSANQSLPGFVVLITGQVLGAGNSTWGSGFLPTIYQGIEFRSQGDPVLFLSNPSGMPDEGRKRVVDSVNRLNQIQLADVGDPEIATRINQYEMAYRMQSSVPELMAIDDEPKSIHEMYGTEPGKTSFANNCLLARRLVERGVRFVQLFDQGWDMHGSIYSALPAKSQQVDRPIAALIRDLKQRGMLDETLVVWSSEFGRTPMAQGRDETGELTKPGRDHHKEAFTVWMAGGGARRGLTYGATDDLGYAPVEKPVHVHDLNATLLHLMGMDHTRLTFKYQGRPFRLTDVHGKVVSELLA